ncbi:5'-3'-deoxyribonucleotidase [Vallitalea sediminicola]
MKRIAIDMDEVMADTLSMHLELINRDFKDNIIISEIQGKSILDVHPHLKDKIYTNLKDPSFFRNIKVMEHSQKVIRELSQYYEIFIASAAMEVPASFTAKYEWLKEHFSFLSDNNFVFCGDKSVINADYLIDDNVKQFKRFSGKGILYTSSRNIYETGYIRVNNWLEVREYFMK